jgi:predicted protein tyrosine phosphatase
MTQNLPFPITICGIEELPGHADRQVTHVLSITDPDVPELEAFGSYGEHARLSLKFHDVIEEGYGMVAPQPEHVDQILSFGRDLMQDPAQLRHLLVHCHMGISRSTASMALLIAQAAPELSADEVLNQILDVREKAWPNLRILQFGEKKLGREGEFTEAAAKVYKLQLERRPEIRTFFRDIGRQREIALGEAA